MKASLLLIITWALGAAGEPPHRPFIRRRTPVRDDPVEVCNAYILDALTQLLWAFNPHCTRWINGTLHADDFNDLPVKEQAQRVASFCQSDCADRYTYILDMARPSCFSTGRIAKSPFSGNQLIAAFFGCEADSLDGSLCVAKYLASLDADGSPSCAFYSSCCAKAYTKFTRGGPLGSGIEERCPGATAALARCDGDAGDDSGDGSGTGAAPQGDSPSQPRPQIDPLGPTVDPTPPANVTAPEVL